MILSKFCRNIFLVLLLSLVLSACATQKAVKIDSKIQGNVYTGTDSVKYLADGVKDRVCFARNESVLTTTSRDTVRKQASWLRKNSDITVVLDGHCDERGTREYNLALGERRANAAKDYLMTYGISSDRISVITASYTHCTLQTKDYVYFTLCAVSVRTHITFTSNLEKNHWLCNVLSCIIKFDVAIKCLHVCLS